MHRIAVLAAALLAGCTTGPSTATPPTDFEAPQFVCHEDGLDRFVGALVNIDVAAQIQRTSSSRVLRWTGPGLVTTMDHRADRVNLGLDESLHRIVRIYCG